MTTIDPDPDTLARGKEENEDEKICTFQKSIPKVSLKDWLASNKNKHYSFAQSFTHFSLEISSTLDTIQDEWNLVYGEVQKKKNAATAVSQLIRLSPVFIGTIFN